MDLLSLSAVELGKAIREGSTTAVEATEAVLARIEAVEDRFHCYVTVDRAGALDKARTVQRKIEEGQLNGPLAGVPMAVKDNLCTAGMRTTCGSRMLDAFVPGYTAEAVEHLERAGAVLIGKTNMDEFAMGSTTETSFYGPTLNPCSPGHVPGGSSGGSAAAVAAGECFFALGSDTGGSIRQPASHCGVVGLKPTFGTVSRYGLVAYGSSLEQAGPLGRTVEDCAAVLEAMSGGETGQRRKDSTLVSREDMDFTSALRPEVKDLRIGIPRDYFGEGIDRRVKEAVLGAAEVFRKNGALVEEFDLGFTEYAVPAYYVIASAEASSNLGRFDGVKYGFRAEQARDLQQMYRQTRSWGFGTEVKRRILLGSFVLSAGYYDACYLKALRARAMIKTAFDRAFERYDCILGPAAPTAAPRVGEGLSDPVRMYLGDIYTVSANLAGLPGICVPCGTGGCGLPVGLQLVAACFQEKKLLRSAYAYECLKGAGKCPEEKNP